MFFAEFVKDFFSHKVERDCDIETTSLEKYFLNVNLGPGFLRHFVVCIDEVIITKASSKIIYMSIRRVASDMFEYQSRM